MHFYRWLYQICPLSLHINIYFSFNRKLFFTDYGNVPKIERCDLDGMNRTRIVYSKAEQPSALALDLVNRLVYWVDLYLDYVGVVDYQGKNRHTIVQGRQVSTILLENAAKIINQTHDTLLKITVCSIYNTLKTKCYLLQI